jgi:putative glutamine amidotransferase
MRSGGIDTRGAAPASSSPFILPPSSLGSPVIGVTGPDRGGGAAWVFTRIAVMLAGGRAVHITPRRPRSLDGLHGLVIGGGADVDPALYGQDPTPILPDAKRPDESWPQYLLELVLFPLTWLLRKLSGKFAAHGGDPARDALETRLLAAALERGLPVLGICRGQQLLNVHFGGSLHQDLRGFYVEDPETRTILPRKRVLTEPGTRLAAILGPQARVNALHRQGVDGLGRGVRVAARDRNGIVQAVEHAALPFVLGVQWHPEYLPQLAGQRAIFRALVGEARACLPAGRRADAAASRDTARILGAQVPITNR